MLTNLMLASIALSSPYAQWSHGLPKDPGYFPIAVWLQNPSNAAKYKAAGINLYIGLWQGPTEEQLAALKVAGMPVICEQNPVGLKHTDDPTIVGWMHGDEPDNAQPDGKGGWGPCIPPDRIVGDYHKLHANDPTRPILLNLGQGVANDEWYGRGTGASLKDYETYVKGGDIVSFDVYPVAGMEKKDGENYLWYVPKGIDRLTGWTVGKKPIWNCVECTRIGSDRRPTPDQVRSEVWMALIHGSKGLIYFVHQFAPTFDEHALLDDPEMLAAVTRLNAQIRSLAPVLNSSASHAASTTTTGAPVDVMAKKAGKEVYLFACGMRNATAKASFAVAGLPKAATATVIDEGRTLSVRSGRFEDDFAPYQVHLYRIR